MRGIIQMCVYSIYLVGVSVLIAATLICWNAASPIVEEARFTHAAFSAGLNITLHYISETGTRCITRLCTDFIDGVGGA